MKKLLFILFLTPVCLSAQEVISETDVEKIKAALPEGVVIKPDYFERKVWIKTPLILTGLPPIISSNSVEISQQFYYMVQKDTSGKFTCGPVRFKLSYTAEKWLFFEQITVISGPTMDEAKKGIGNKYEIYVEHLDKTTTVNSANSITESFDIIGSSDVLNWLKDMADNQTSSVLRFKGKTQYHESQLKAKISKDKAKSFLESIDIVKSI